MPELILKLTSEEVTLMIYSLRDEVIKEDSPSTQEKLQTLRMKIANKIVEYSAEHINDSVGLSRRT